MKMTLRLSLSIIIFSLNTAVFAAEPCEENFSSNGSFFSGATFKTYADLPNVNIDNALRNIAAFTSNSGFTVLTVDKNQGLISAVQADSYARGKKIPLDIAVENAGSGVKVSMIYTTPAGTLSPEDTVKSHFCKTIAVAAGPSIAANPTARQSVRNIAVNNSPAQRGLASITSEQQAKIMAAVSGKGLKDQRVKQNLVEAADAISGFLRINSCIANYNGLSLNIYAAPNHQFPGSNYLSPMSGARYHDKNSCLTILRLQGITAPALNALRFEAVYLAEDSGESVIKEHEAVRQPDGQWLFNR
jgi:hypothetical protein